MRFHFNSPLMEYMNTAVQFIGLNFLFILCCIPIVTIGPAVAALYQVTLRESRGEHGYIFRTFFRYFKEMFMQSIFTFILGTAVVLLLLFNIIFWNNLSSAFSDIIVVLLVILLFLVSCTVIYVFPLMARFKNSFGNTIKNSFLIAVTNLKTTIGLLLIHAITVGILMIFPPGKVFMLLVGFSFIAYCNSYLLNKAFKQYEPSVDTGYSE